MEQPLGVWGSQNCQVHRTHKPQIHGTHIHHIQPMAFGGPDIPANKVETCPTGHTNIHILFDLLVDYDGALSRDQTKGFARREVKLAVTGYRLWVDAGKPRGRA